jgi:hypothetical protein
MTLLGRMEETLAWVPARTLDALDASARDEALVPARAGERGVRALREGNRSVVVPGEERVIDRRTMHLSVKGCGASAPMYGESPFRAGGVGIDRVITRELWMGEAPYGGQGEEGARAALALSRLVPDGALGGFCVCPVTRIVEVPEARIDDALAYRRYEGRVVQEHRLVPSDVRLFAGSERTLGAHTDEVLHGFGVTRIDDLEAFVETFLRTAIAALTLWARTAREGEQGLVGLDLDDVWLDKDAVLAPDGSLFFVDLEALEWVTGWPSVEARVRRQLGRNAYEVLYALDVLLDARERRRGRPTSRAERRAAVRALTSTAIEGDPFVRAVPAHGEREGGLDLIVRVGGAELALPWIDEAMRARESVSARERGARA